MRLIGFSASMTDTLQYIVSYSFTGTVSGHKAGNGAREPIRDQLIAGLDYSSSS